MKRYDADEFLADLNRAIELNPGDAEAIASRGQLYAAMTPARGARASRR